MFKKIPTLLVAGAALLEAVGPALAQKGTEQPKYEVIKLSDGVELRRYAPHLVAEITVVAGSMREASRTGFGPLARYIFGNNQGERKIAMTAPVTTQEKTSGTEIAMTAPVTTSANENGAYTIRFSMPSKWTLDTLPIPNDDEIQTNQVDTEIRVAYQFVGARSQARINEATAKIAAFLEAEKLEATSSIIIAGYDGPSVPIRMKRWEVMQILERSEHP